MYISKSFIPILKNNPSEAKIKSHQLMLRVGMIKQALKIACRKFSKERTGKKPFTNINLVRI